MLRDFNAFKFNLALGERNGTNGEESGWGKSETMYDGLRFLYRVCSFVHFTVSFQRSSEGRRVCTVGVGKAFQISFQAFFSSVHPYRHPRARPTGGKMWNVHQGWAYRTLRVWPTFSILFRGGFSVSRIFIIHCVFSTHVVFLACSISLRCAGCP